MDPHDVDAAVARVHRAEWATVLSATARLTRDLDLAEECVQDAFSSALRSWRPDGIPDRPGAWLTTAARRRALDVLRRQTLEVSKRPLLIEEPTDLEDDVNVDTDDRLRLIYLCCHPALGAEAQLALTLRLVCGLTTNEIASALLVSEPTMAARLTRAKRKIALAGIPLRLPTPSERPQRTIVVLAVIYQVFTAGHTPHFGPGIRRDDLIAQSRDLANQLLERDEDDAEIRGLLALMLAIESRRETRADTEGLLVDLEHQDRSLWDRDMLSEARRLVRGTPSLSSGRYELQARIALEHGEAPNFSDTDWAAILGLYDLLLQQWPSPVVALNRSVALAKVAGPEIALAAVRRLQGDRRLEGYRYLPVVEADLLWQLGRRSDSIAALRGALTHFGNDTERAALERRLAERADVLLSDQR
jgi:RNA polymerase sigma-70 factor (ECF subfamily)